MAKSISMPSLGASPKLVAVFDALVEAERRWMVANRKSEESAETKAAWAMVTKAEAAIVRFKCKTVADIAAKMRLDAHFGGISDENSSDLLKSVLRDTERM